MKKLSNELYRKEKGISSSDLKYLAISPLHFELYQKGYFQQEDNKNLIFGDAFHALVLEPDRFEKEFAVEDFEGCNLNKNTKAYKEAKAKWLEEVGDRNIISADDFKELEKMRDITLALASPLLNGEKEVSVFATDRHGIVRKCRPDVYNKDLGLIVDLKTTSAKNDYEFQKAVVDFKYHWQAYHYMETLRLAGLPANKFIFIVVSKSKEHMTWIVELDNKALEVASTEVEELINSYVRYLQTGEANVVKTLSLPSWYA